ncbi:unnamed protein product, partial [Meganyctiphanes norvegica]
MGKHLLVIGALLLAATTSSALNLLQEIKARPNLSQAARIIELDALLPRELETKQYTAFIPSNVAISQYEGKKDANLLKYHLANIPYRVQDLPSEINSDLMGNPKLYVTRFPSGKPATSGWDDVDYYINNAKVTYANVNATADSGYSQDSKEGSLAKGAGVQQVLHIVDQVIIPTFPEGNVDSKYFYPDAKTLLSKPEIYGLKDDKSISKFDERVEQLKMSENFELTGANTFFIPVNQALTDGDENLQDVIDKQVVHGHILPNKVLFTRTAEGNNEEYPSFAFTDNLKVLISMEKVKNPEDDTDAFYVKSNTKSGDNAHKTGTVLAKIVHGNIPVKNGVVHLIDRPLMVVAASIMSYLSEEDGQLKLFYELMREHYNELSQQLAREKADLTLFAPSNAAFEHVNEDRFKAVKLNKDKLGKLLKLHIVPQRLTTDMIIDKSSRQIFQEETLSNRRKLYFAVNDSNPANPIVSLEGAGVNATITTQNIAAKNGVIHIIDRILGIPSETVHQKLKTDPMLSDTWTLSQQDEWNARLDLKNEKYTFFAPSNDAWDFIKREMPSAHKKLFMGEFSYHVKHILERHMIVGSDLNLDELALLTQENATVRGDIREKQMQMARGKIYFQAKIKKSFGDISLYSHKYYVEWNGIQAKVIRPDVECVNGVVHVIDQVIMMNRDVTINASPATFTAGHITTLCATFITIISTKILH